MKKLLGWIIPLTVFIFCFQSCSKNREKLSPRSVSVRGYHSSVAGHVRPSRRRPPGGPAHDRPYEANIILCALGALASGSFLVLQLVSEMKTRKKTDFRSATPSSLSLPRSYPPTSYAPRTSASPSQKLCSACSKPMRKINGRRGLFWGCTGFPNCRYTEDA